MAGAVPGTVGEEVAGEEVAEEEEEVTLPS
jgi:hypothetical protein